MKTSKTNKLLYLYPTSCFNKSYAKFGDSQPSMVSPLQTPSEPKSYSTGTEVNVLLEHPRWDKVFIETVSTPVHAGWVNYSDIDFLY